MHWINHYPLKPYPIAWDRALQWGKKAKKGGQIGKVWGSKASLVVVWGREKGMQRPSQHPRLPLVWLYLPIFFFHPRRFFSHFPPMQNLVQG